MHTRLSNLKTLYTGPVLSQLDQLLPVRPALELSTLGCSSTHNNTLQVLQRTVFGPHLPIPVLGFITPHLPIPVLGFIAPHLPIPVLGFIAPHLPIPVLSFISPHLPIPVLSFIAPNTFELFDFPIFRLGSSLDEG